MPKRKHSDSDEDDPPPTTAQQTTARPSFLKIRLPNEYRALLPDLLLLDVARVDYVQANGKSARYLYRVIALVPDQCEDQIRLYTTPSGTDVDDNNDCWDFVANDDSEYEGGVFLCRPLHGMPIYHIVDFSRPQSHMDGKDTREFVTSIYPQGCI